MTQGASHGGASVVRTPPGPGARRGLNRLHGRALDLGALAPADSPGEARFIKEMGLLLGALRDSDRAFCSSLELDIHDVQFQLCEYDKYRRVEDGGHTRPYTPTSSHTSIRQSSIP